jgi:hypothetical protein
MNIHDCITSESYVLNEQIARQVFNVLEDKGPVIFITDRDGNCWPSDTDKFSKLNLSEGFLRELYAKIDDGVEPVVTQAGDISIIGTGLATERTNCGYLIVALAESGAESSLVNINLAEMVLNQIGLIATLIEKNNLLYALQLKHHNIYGQGVLEVN